MESATYTIRPLAPKDYERISRLFDELDGLHSERLPWLFQKPERSPRDELMLRALVTNERAMILVADVGEVAGFVHVALRESPSFSLFVPQVRGLIENVYVTPAWRRPGADVVYLLESRVAAYYDCTACELA